MFYYIEGVVEIMDQNLAVIDVGGAGYACFTTMNTLSHLELGKKTRLYTYCNVKEDAFDIYGFHEPGEKRFFEQLITVSGVGPKAALSILSTDTPEALAMAIANGDEKMLMRAPGVGKKIAQRIILELKDKLAKVSLSQAGVGALSAPSDAQAAPGTKISDAASALVVLGYSQSEISAVLRSVDTESMSVEEIIREVLKNSLKG